MAPESIPFRPPFPLGMNVHKYRSDLHTSTTGGNLSREVAFSAFRQVPIGRPTLVFASRLTQRDLTCQELNLARVVSQEETNLDALNPTSCFRGKLQTRN